MPEVSQQMPQSFFQRRSVFVVVVLCLLGVLVAEEWLSTGRLSVTDDEVAHIYAGYQHWKARDFGVNPEHPPLVKMVATAPLLSMQLKQPGPAALEFHNGGVRGRRRPRLWQ